MGASATEECRKLTRPLYLDGSEGQDARATAGGGCSLVEAEQPLHGRKVKPHSSYDRSVEGTAGVAHAPHRNTASSRTPSQCR